MNKILYYEKLSLEHLESKNTLYCGNGSNAGFNGTGDTYGCSHGGNLIGNWLAACTDGAGDAKGSLGRTIYWCANGPSITDCQGAGATVNDQPQRMIAACHVGGGLNLFG